LPGGSRGLGDVYKRQIYFVSVGFAGANLINGVVCCALVCTMPSTNRIKKRFFIS
jgi:hypothetical protein